MIKNENGFTLIEMLVVLAVISILLILFIPNLASKNEEIQTKGCEALIELGENQLLSYKLDNGGVSPTNLEELINKGYMKSISCDNGNKTLAYKTGSTDELTTNQTP
ncbi:competence type IV pilus major pilin ComGC [Saliterribacillus persicus]|uniref:ComG operon protein 3 n=1 Tax=Saliterribacillus persicus TaxID=930114 RepID=A0A368XBP1_9BACI|nr:competence type IV pilus major pilin ComGC [Saliterribacillus persicus]RCW65383.1 competence protein ComGC [Saliterribacillus persicus]